jgi:hypothetical protein
VARLLLIVTLLAAGLGMLPLGGAPGSLRFTASSGVASAATGDRWVWPGPPVGGSASASFYDRLRDRLTFLQRGSRGVECWTVPSDTGRTWSVTRFVSIPGGPEGRWLSDLSYVYDAPRDRLLLVDGSFVLDDTCCGGHERLGVWEVPLGGIPTYVPIPSRGAVPPYHPYNAVAFDTRRNRLLIGAAADDGNGHRKFELDACDLASDSASWSVMASGASPAAVQNACAAYDSTADRMFLFGGFDSLGNSNFDLYSLDLGTSGGWQLQPAGALPKPFVESQPEHVVFDSAGRRLLLSSASYGNGTVYSGVWEADLAALDGWKQVPFTGPDVGNLAGQPIYDPSRNRLSTFGEPAGRSDLFEAVLDGASAWNRVLTSDRPATFARDAAAFLDPGGSGLLLVDQEIIAPYWTLRPGATLDWESHNNYNAAHPQRRTLGAIGYDPSRRRGVLYGGSLEGVEIGDLWQFTIDDTNTMTWQRLFPEGDAPSPRWGQSMIFDPVRGRFVMYGGYAGRPLGDTWELTLDPTPRWRRIPDRGVPPPGRSQASAVYDSRRDAMLVYGGNLGPSNAPVLTDETWALSFIDGDIWVPLATLGRPPSGRTGHRAIYDSRRDRMLVLWGDSYNGGRSDCSELDLAGDFTWYDYAPGGVTPSGRSGFGAIYDPTRDQAFILGGRDPINSDAFFPLALVGDFSANPVTSPPPLTGPPLAVLGLAPNPTRDVENVAFELPVDATVRARIYDARGRLVRDLGPKRYVAGGHILLWDGKNRLGEIPPSGVYFARLSILGKEFSGKFVLLH